MVDTQMSITVMNPSAAKMLGCNADECIGCSVFEVFSSDSGVGTSLEKAMESRTFLEEERVIRVGSKSIPLAFLSSPVFDEDHKLIGAVETFNDLSKLRQMEEEIQQARILGALGEMAATVAHEIRNPLGGIGGYAGLLARDIPAEDPKRKLVERIIQGVSSLNKIVSNLLFYTRKSELRRVPVEVHAWLEDILNYMEIEIEKDGTPVAIGRDYESTEIVVEMDPEKLQQVVLNLLHNAVQAMDGPGQVFACLREEDGWCEIEIRDNGKGIDQANLEHIFTPFFTTKEHGTGLGLAISKKIVELHRGHLEVYSSPGMGTSFVLRLRIRV
jgi:PAS domain S-box-containing protein